jgi:CRP/FNR family cyclic AMP-dependent transcriptional regulator
MPRGGEPQFTDHRDCQTLTGLTLEKLPRDGSLGRIRHYRKGANVWRPEDRANNVFFLRRGQVAVMMCDADGHNVIVRMIEEGEPFGELCFCSAEESVRQTSARAVVESEAVEIKFKDFLGYLQENREALTALVFTFCVRLAEAEHRVEVLAHRGAEERLGRLLLQLANSRGKTDAERKEELVLPVSHDDLAQMAAMSRPHVTVTMGKLRKQGLVRYGRGQALAVNVPALKSFLVGERSHAGDKGKGGSDG